MAWLDQVSYRALLFLFALKPGVTRNALLAWLCDFLLGSVD
jgi:hypothetical protein